jgi:hypothetical protein
MLTTERTIVRSSPDVRAHGRQVGSLAQPGQQDDARHDRDRPARDEPASSDSTALCAEHRREDDGGVDDERHSAHRTEARDDGQHG